MIKSPFDVAKEITGNKKPWNEEVQSAWNTFVVNRVLSMNPDNIELIDYVQRYFNIPPKNLYEFYSELIPQSRFYPYVKRNGAGNTTKNIELYKSHYGFSNSEAKEYVLIYGAKNIDKDICQSDDGDFTISKLKKSETKSDRRKTRAVS